MTPSVEEMRGRLRRQSESNPAYNLSMSSTLTPDLTQLKAGMKTTWMAGDFGQVAAYMANESARVVERL